MKLLFVDVSQHHFEVERCEAHQEQIGYCSFHPVEGKDFKANLDLLTEAVVMVLPMVLMFIFCCSLLAVLRVHKSCNEDAESDNSAANKEAVGCSFMFLVIVHERSCDHALQNTSEELHGHTKVIDIFGAALFVELHLNDR